MIHSLCHRALIVKYYIFVAVDLRRYRDNRDIPPYMTKESLFFFISIVISDSAGTNAHRIKITLICVSEKIVVLVLILCILILHRGSADIFAGYYYKVCVKLLRSSDSTACSLI